MKRGKIQVDFSERGKFIGAANRDPWVPGHRKYGGCGVLSAPEPYAGPKEFKLEGGRRGRHRVFRIVRLERSPTGSGHGSFRIDEVLKTSHGEKVVCQGYTCSVPDFDACIRVAEGSNNH